VRWGGPETVLIDGNPALLDGGTEGHNIQLDMPSRGPAGQELHGAMAVAALLGEAFGISPDRLLEIAKIDKAFFQALPDELAHELIVQQLESPEVRKHMEAPLSSPPVPGSSSPSAAAAGGGGGARASRSSPSEANNAPEMERALAGARPAEVTVGGRVRGQGTPNRLLIEKFDFGQHSALARLGFGVHEELRLSGGGEGADNAEAVEQLRAQIDRIRSGRREALLEEMPAVYTVAKCVICLSGDPKPDAVLYQCGHRCAHMRCVEGARLRRCPLCRARVAAVLHVP